MYLGDFAEDGDIYFKFTTRRFSTGAPTTLAGSPVLRVYVDEATATEKTTAETYFDLDVDFDGLTGLNNVRIDLSGDVFFATGADYTVVIGTGTVDSVSVVGEVIATFSIENRSMGQPAGTTLAADVAAVKAETVLIVADTNELQTDDIPGTISALNNLSAANVATELGTYDGPTKAEMDTAHGLLATPANVASELGTYDGPTRAEVTADKDEVLRSAGLLASTTILAYTSQTSFTLTTASADNDAYNGAIIVITDQTTAVQRAVGLVSDYTGASKTVTLIADPLTGFTFANGDLVDIIASPKSLPATVLNDVSAADVNAQCDTALSDYDGPTKAEMDTAHALLATPAQVATELGTYDGPTKAEMDTAHALLATVDGVWNEAKAGHVGAGSFGEEVQAHGLSSEISGLNDLSAANVNSEIVDALDTDTYAELVGVPAATSTLVDKINWLFILARNKLTQTAGVQLVRNDADSGTVGSSTISDDTTTGIRGEFS